MDETGNSSSTTPQSSRGKERRARILEAATTLFLKDGYGATSIDSILEVSGGSKATLYSYFPTKDDLFRAVIDEVLASRREPSLDRSADPRSALVEFAVQRLEVVLSDRHHALLRLIIAERERFPDLAREYYDHAPLRSLTLLERYFAELERKDAFEQGAAKEASELFIAMLVHWWIMEVLLLGDCPSSDAIRERAVQVVDRFLAAFRRPASGEHASSA